MSIEAKHKLIKHTLPLIGSDAFTLLFAIAFHIGKDGSKTAWPGLNRLRKMALVDINGKLRPMPVKRAYRAINRMITARVLERWQERPGGDFGLTKYKLTTPYMYISMRVDGFEMEDTKPEDSRVVENDHTPADSRVVVLGDTRNGVTQNDHTEDTYKIEDTYKREDTFKLEVEVKGNFNYLINFKEKYFAPENLAAREAVCMGQGIKEKELEVLAGEFLNKKTAINQQYNSTEDVITNFVYWLPSEINRRRREKSTNNGETRPRSNQQDNAATRRAAESRARMAQIKKSLAGFS